MAARRDVLLAGVLDLILSNIDKIVDDTSLEKLLDVLESNYKNVKQDGGMCVNPMILEFFSRVKHVQCRAATISFALRLCGIVSKCSEGFHVMSGLDNVLQYLFDEILEKPELWWEAPAVRDSYFKAAFAILNSNDGFLWAQNSGVLQKAMECLVDSSIFVIDSSRKFIAKYLISLYKSSKDSNYQIDLNDMKGSSKHDCLEINTSIFSADLNTCYKCFLCHLKYVTEQLPAGLERTMSRHVSVAQLLLELFEADAVASQEMLRSTGIMRSCFKLLSHINRDECGKVVDVIFTLLTTDKRLGPIDWVDLLNCENKQDLFHTFLEFILVLYERHFVSHAFQLVQGVFKITYVIDLTNRRVCEPALCLLFALVAFPVHATLRKMEDNDADHLAHQSVDIVIKRLLSTQCLTNDSYETVLGILNKTLKDCLSSSAVAKSLTVTTDIISDRSYMTSVMSAVVKIIQLWCKDILDFHNEQSDDYYLQEHSSTKLFIKALAVCLKRGVFEGDCPFNGNVQCYNLLLKILLVSQDIQVISACFEALKCLFSEVGGVFPSYVNVETLNQLLVRHCSNSCWDVRDSTLFFLQHLITTLDAECIVQLLETNLPVLLWKLMEDSESYVRARSVRLLYDLSIHNVVWKKFCEAISLSEEEILQYIFNTFEQEEAAFARRATIEVLNSWLMKTHSILLPHLQENLFEPLAKVVHKAREDFDWEVKLRALHFWEILFRLDEEGQVRMSNTFLNEIGAVLFGAIIDCDEPVRTKGQDFLRVVKLLLIDWDDIDVVSYEGSIDELKEFILQTKEKKNCSLLQTLLAIDFFQFVTACEEGNLMHEPFSFLEDVLAATSENKDNLLDCY